MTRRATLCWPVGGFVLGIGSPERMIFGALYSLKLRSSSIQIMSPKDQDLNAPKTHGDADYSARSAQESVDLDRVDAYDYELPEELIAAHPSARRSGSRLLVATRDGSSLAHRNFGDLLAYLKPGDLLVFNNTRVIPARVMTHKSSGGAVELLILDVVDPVDSELDTPSADADARSSERWTRPAGAGGKVAFRCMTRSSRRLRPGMELSADQAALPPFVVREYAAGHALVEVAWEDSAVALLEQAGQMPLPPYIVKRRKDMGEAETATAADQKRYQTVYAAKPGAVAAPTAGLHFSDALFEELDALGVQRAFVTLQVGAGTFKPISAERLSEHEMHSEEYEISAELAEAIARTRAAGGRVIAVGTTSARALEAEARRQTPFEPGLRRTDIFLFPGEPFKVCDALITNFHLPRSTLLALVAAFAGYDFMCEIYRSAVAEKYRFYSYGDSVFIR
ncbi:S-adenosylmethionine:tRNA ribosyltransferase-isomerase [Bradymonas sediminis]|nr:S-adenosylmethionine:tRNA ribosyltransferase-isomerase [Bradymonas sediminis]